MTQIIVNGVCLVNVLHDDYDLPSVLRLIRFTDQETVLLKRVL